MVLLYGLYRPARTQITARPATAKSTAGASVQGGQLQQRQHQDPARQQGRVQSEAKPLEWG